MPGSARLPKRADLGQVIYSSSTKYEDALVHLYMSTTFSLFEGSMVREGRCQAASAMSSAILSSELNSSP